MTDKKAKQGGGGKLNKTQTVTLRLDPKLRYLTDLAARKQRRTTSGFIEWAIEEAIKNMEMRYDEDYGGYRSLHHESFDLWDVDEPDRFVKLAQRYPDLLTHDEQVLWKVISEFRYLYNMDYVDPAGAPKVNRLDRRLVRKYWLDLNSVAKKEMSIESLIEIFEDQDNG